MIDKQGNKRKISFRYICWFIGSVIMFTAFFLILVLHYRIFDKYETTEIIKIKLSLTRITFRVGDKIQYLAGNPDKIFPDRIKGIVILSCAEAVIVALLIGTTIFEIKKGL